MEERESYLKSYLESDGSHPILVRTNRKWEQTETGRQLLRPMPLEVNCTRQQRTRLSIILNLISW